MTKFESSIKHIAAPQGAVYAKLSDLNNLENIKDRLPEDKVKGLEFDADSLSFEASPVGKITLQIVEREPEKCIKFGTTSSPLPFNLWIQIVAVTETECKINRHGAEPVYEGNGAKALAGRIRENGRHAGHDSVRINGTPCRPKPDQPVNERTTI